MDNIVERIIRVMHPITLKTRTSNNVMIGGGIIVKWDDGTFTHERRCDLKLI